MTWVGFFKRFREQPVRPLHEVVAEMTKKEEAAKEARRQQQRINDMKRTLKQFERSFNKYIPSIEADGIFHFINADYIELVKGKRKVILMPVPIPAYSTVAWRLRFFELGLEVQKEVPRADNGLRTEQGALVEINSFLTNEISIPTAAASVHAPNTGA